MIALHHMAGKRVAVFGLGASGLVTAHALAAGGAEVLCYDDSRARTEAADAAGLPTGDLRVADFAAFDALVLAPGVPLTHPEPHWTVERASAAGVPIVGDIDLFDVERRARLPHTKVIAITGTNGKSTTTALLGHLLKEMGANVQIGGNIGRPALDLDPHEGVVVLEVSSFQIDLAPHLSPDVGVLLNITSDHLDRHGSLARYREIKRSLIRRSAKRVIGYNDVTAHAFARLGENDGHFGFWTLRFEPTDGVPRTAMDTPYREISQHAFADAVVAMSRVERQTFETAPHLRDVHVGWTVWHERGGGDEEVPLGAFPQVPSLRGDHNVANAMAALAAIAALGLDPADAMAHLASFPGLPHRLEEVGRDGDVLFINDSKATNFDSTDIALKSFRNVHWIAGGKAKPGGVSALEAERYSIRRAYLIGAAAQEFEASLAGKVETKRCGTLDVALDAAAAAARAEGGVVLLSPACASFDQFRSFEERGDVFRSLVHERLSTKGAA